MMPRQIAKVVGCNRNTVERLIYRWGFGEEWQYSTRTAENERGYRAARRKPTYKEGDYEIVSLDREKVCSLIKADLTIPQIAETMPEFTYDQVYDTILCDAEFNSLYRKHAQLKIKKG